MNNWFKKLGWLYRPVNIIGWVITLIPLAVCLQIFVAVDRHSHSVSDTALGVFPYFVCIAVVWYWIAYHTTAKA